MIRYETKRYMVREEDGRLVGEEKPHRAVTDNRTVHVQRLDGDLDASVSAAFDAIDAASIIRPGRRVAIKINLGGGIHYVPTTYSDPVICEAIIKKIRALGGAPFVCEADMRGHVMHEKLLHVRGYDGMLERQKVGFTNLSRGKTVRMTCRDLDIPLLLPEKLLDPEVAIISFAPPKHHWECGITGCQKNMYGAIAEWRKSMYHRRYRLIDHAVAAAARLMTPDINILATFDLGTKLGPHFCTPVPFRRMLIARDMIRIDKAASEILGYPYRLVKYAMINTGGEDVDYDLHPDADWPDETTLRTIHQGAITPRSVAFWKAMLYPQYFLPHRLQITVFPPLEFLATWANRCFFAGNADRKEEQG